MLVKTQDADLMDMGISHFRSVVVSGIVVVYFLSAISYFLILIQCSPSFSILQKLLFITDSPSLILMVEIYKNSFSVLFLT